VTYRAEMAYARLGGREWPISEVPRAEMVWSPRRREFAYLLPPQSQPPTGTSGQHHVVIRNLRGDSINAFATYRSGRALRLIWIDHKSLAYRLPDTRGAPLWVIHSAETGQIIDRVRGTLVASPLGRRVAYVAGTRQSQRIMVGTRAVWPRGIAVSRGRRVISDLVWSPSGEGLAFMAVDGTQRQLVVLLSVDDQGGDMSWPLPQSADVSDNQLFWAANRVIVGESPLKPRFSASWRRIR
jgi:hypothetical protein